ncbi:hypothetical protein FFK22_038305 [Mycobacterium sp. KBS0706]|uniref:hypothetical protein n=1 Tax=Mycobacterium sp. KBS0706 TaxID=2578109 RepID=UPI00110F97F8|nr:hypothetical protein [Mycobacterium sp. KBS0706]TSD83339.1 hypothetical protein FFK22_038305 [Mycobacterium sp. KBS0706]
MSKLVSACAAMLCAAALLVPSAASAQLDVLQDIFSSSTGAGTSAPTGQEPSAQVTAISGAPGADVEVTDSVYPGQTIDLGRSGRLTLAYGDGCTVETIHGGVVTVGTASSRVAGGQVQTSSGSCGRTQVAATARSSEAGAVSNRLGNSPFDPRLWAETTVTSARPQFSGAEGSVSIVMLDAPAPQTVWEGQGGGGFRYPGNAPKLQTGVPYKIVAGGRSAVFSVDPGAKGAGGTVVLR